MAIEGSVCIEYVENLKITKHRGVAWLIVKPPDKHITAKAIFEKLNEKKKQMLFSRFEYWIDGGIHDKYFHGWNEDDYRDCFVFKLNNLRLFGFLCNPKKDEPSFQLCVLCSHSLKDGWEADKSEKDRMNELKKDEKILVALKNIKKNCSENENNELDGTKNRQFPIKNYL
jgi:hypothetical protein